jgi:CRISPR-associated endonuclease/helicase Cas3
MTVLRLLAKSSNDPDQPLPAETLAGHLDAVGQVARRLVETRGALMLAALGLDPRHYEELFAKAVVLGALLHDIGKANDQFQRMVRGQTTLAQALRHEVVGLWLLTTTPELHDWLFSETPLPARLIALRAVAGHHLQFRPGDSLQPRASGAVALQVYTGHPDFTAALRAIGQQVGRPEPPQMADRRLPLTEPRALQPVRALIAELDQWWQHASGEWRRLAAAVAALVIAADVCGSAVLRAYQDPAEWAAATLGTACSGPDLVSAAARRLGGRPLRPFQQAVAASPARLTLVTAGCGTGKTAAAYHWAAHRAAGRKLFFCYPTTSTATEGFVSYAFPEFQTEAELVHSRAALDIIRFLENGRQEDTNGVTGQLLRYQGLQPWGAKVIVCTADAVLGLIQQYRAGMFSFPALTGAAFVFDEVHLYDDRLFGALMVFLEAFRGTPVLLMTATLQPRRRETIHALAQRLGEPVSEIAGPPELERLPRYVIETAQPEEARRQAFAAAAEGQRVLWVVNTVDRAITLAQEAEQQGIPVEPYHSRYRYRDRLDRHRAVVDRFQPGADAGGVLAVTTQVCEVSLDISADLLVTELADVTALIQRLGRLNRWATPESGASPRPALVVEPPDAPPYTREALATARRWLTEVAGRPVAQADLDTAFQALLAAEPPPPRVASAWLDESWALEPAPLRQPGATVPVIREEDLATCADAQGRMRLDALIGATVPMLWGPVAAEAGGWRTVRGVLVAPPGRIDYSPRWGARWREQRERGR